MSTSDRDEGQTDRKQAWRKLPWQDVVVVQGIGREYTLAEAPQQNRLETRVQKYSWIKIYILQLSPITILFKLSLYCAKWSVFLSCSYRLSLIPNSVLLLRYILVHFFFTYCIARHGECILFHASTVLYSSLSSFSHTIPKTIYIYSGECVFFFYASYSTLGFMHFNFICTPSLAFLLSSLLFFSFPPTPSSSLLFPFLPRPSHQHIPAQASNPRLYLPHT